MARKKKPPEHVNHERWLVSYADFITLLFAFFTTMYAISTVDAQKVGKMMFSMQQAFNVDFFPSEDAILGGTPRSNAATGDNAAPPPPQIAPSLVRKSSGGGGSGKADVALRENKRMRALAHQVVHLIQTRGLAGKVGVRVEPNRGLVISLAEAAFFGSGEAVLQDDSHATMDAIAEILGRAPMAVRVEGHSDDRPIRTSQYPSNWALSTARAVHIVQTLIEEYDFPSDRLSAAGYSSFRPVDTNETAEGRARNRRVDIVLLNSLAEAEEPSTEPPQEPSRPAFLPPEEPAEL